MMHKSKCKLVTLKAAALPQASDEAGGAVRRLTCSRRNLAFLSMMAVPQALVAFGPYPKC